MCFRPSISDLSGAEAGSLTGPRQSEARSYLVTWQCWVIIYGVRSNGDGDREWIVHMVRRKYRSRVRLDFLSSFDVFADINRGVHDRSYRGV